MITWIFLCCWLIVTIFTSVAIVRSDLLTSTQKLFNLLLNAILPVVWFLMVRSFLSANTTVMTKTQRDNLQKKRSGSTTGTTDYTDS